jgi:hypothetical protein
MKACVVGIAAMFVAACTGTDGGANASVGGVYRGTVVNHFNTCPGTWTKGMVNQAMVSVGQMQASVTIQVDGTVGSMLQARLGTNSFAGVLTGNHINAIITGTVESTLGGCVFTSNGELAADLGGNILSGVIIYTPQTNGHADCASMQVTGCIAKQTFGASRIQ